MNEIQVLRDPEGVEIAKIHQYAQPTGKRVLEVGSGEGRLIWQYGESAAQIYGIDLDRARTRKAFRTRPTGLASRVHLALAEAEAMPFPKEAFDLAILAWSF